MDEALPQENSRLLSREISRVWAVAWPLVLTNVLTVMVGIIDLKMVGALGVEPIAAVGMARQVINFIMVIMIAISGGCSVLVARAYGAGDREMLRRVTARSVMLMIASAILLVTPAGLLTSRIFLIGLGATDRVVDLGVTYLNTLFIGSVFTSFTFAISAVLLGVGKTRVSLLILLGVNILNVPLNYLLIFGAGPIPALGIQGAALGTVLAQAAGSVAGIWVLGSPRFPFSMRLSDGLSLDLELAGKILYLGGPRSLQGVVRNFSGLMTIRIITLLPDPTRAVSAYSVGMQVRMLSNFIGLAFMSASIARVGQNMGAGDTDLAEKSGWISAWMAAAIMSVMAIAFFVIPDQIMGFFTDDTEVIDMGRSFFIIIAFSEPFMAFSFSLSGALRGGGDSVAPFLYSSVSDLLVAILAGYILAVPLGMGFSGIAIGIAVGAVTRTIPSIFRWRCGKWKTMKL